MQAIFQNATGNNDPENGEAMGKTNTVAKTNEWIDLEEREKLYRSYANAVEEYVKEPTAANWEKKEKAFETYNALIEYHRNIN